MADSELVTSWFLQRETFKESPLERKSLYRVHIGSIQSHFCFPSPPTSLLGVGKDRSPAGTAVVTPGPLLSSDVCWLAELV